MINDLLERDLKLLANGYEPIVEHRAIPAYSGFIDAVASAESIKSYRERWDPQDGCLFQGTAIRTWHTPCVDIDIYDQKLAMQVKGIVEDRLGVCPRYPYRVGTKGFAMLYRTEQPFPTIKINGGDGLAVEIICKGSPNKISWFGPHAKRNGIEYKQYGAPLEAFPRDALFEITQEQAIALAHELRTFLLGNGATKVSVYGDGEDPKLPGAYVYGGDRDPDHACRVGHWEMERGGGPWDDYPIGGRRYDALKHRAARLYALGVPKEHPEGNGAYNIIDEWANKGDIGGYDAHAHLDGVYDSLAKAGEVFGASLYDPFTKRKASDIWSPMDMAAHTRQLMEEVGLAPKEAKAGQIFFQLSEAREQWRDPSMLIKGLIPDSAVTIVYGDTNAGKTYFAVEIAGCVAMGQPVYDIPEFQVEVGKSCSEKGCVVILAGENGESVAKSRLLAWEEAHGVKLEGKVLIARHAIPLDDESDATGWKAYVRALDAVNTDHGPIRLIINDTLKRSIGALDSNKSETAHLFTSLTEALAEKYSCAIIVNAHRPKTGGGIGGSKDFENGVSWSYELEKMNKDTKALESVKITGVKARTGQQPMPFVVKRQIWDFKRNIAGNHSDLVFNIDGNIVEKPGKPSDDDVLQVVEILKREGCIQGVEPEKTMGVYELIDAMVETYCKQMGKIDREARHLKLRKMMIRGLPVGKNDAGKELKSNGTWIRSGGKLVPFAINLHHAGQDVIRFWLHQGYAAKSTP